MSKLAYAALWLQIFILPFELFVTAPGFGTLGRLGGVGALAFGVLYLLQRGTLRPPAGAHVAMLLFVASAALSIFWSIDAEGTQLRAMSYLQLAILAWLIWEVAPGHERQLGLLQAYVLGAYVSVIDTYAKYLEGSTVATGRFAASGFNPNDLGFTLVIAIPMAWYLSLVGKRRILTIVNRLYVPLGMGAIMLTASRGAFIPALAALLIIPWTFSRQRWPTKLTMCVLVLASGLFLQRFVPETSWERLSGTMEEVESGSFSYRGTIWRAGFAAFVEHPVIGVGAGAFATAVEPFLGSSRSPHQTLLSVLVGQGVIGLALFIGMFAMALPPIRRMAPQQRAFWVVMLLTLAVGLQPRTWDYRKPLWFLLGVLAAQSAIVPARVSRRRPSGFRVVAPPARPEPSRVP